MAHSVAFPIARPLSYALAGSGDFLGTALPPNALTLNGEPLTLNGQILTLG